MGISPVQLRMDVIRPCLKDFGLWSQDAENLILGTAAQESWCGRYVRQLHGGPALGIFQMEPATHDDIWKNFLAFRRELRGSILEVWDSPDAERMIYDLRYAAVMCRVHYLRAPGAIPTAVGDQAKYWKLYYNTPAGAGTEAEFIDNWYRHIEG